MIKSPELHELDKARSELNQAKQRLEELDLVLCALVQAIPATYLHLGFDGTILSYTAPSSPESRFLCQDPIGKRVQDILPSDIAHRFLEKITQVLQGQTSIQFDFSLPMDGRQQDFEARFAPFMERRVIAIVSSASELKQTQGWLATCRRLITLGQMTAGVAHELNNPLSVILGFAQSLTLHPYDHTSLASYLQSIEHEALRCKRLVQDLLSFARHHPSSKTPEDLIQVLQEALSLVETQTRISHIELARDFAEDLPRVILDRHQIQQMIINLGTNAIDAMPQGGNLTVSASLVGPSDGEDHPCIEIRVRDTGTGIPPEIRDRIFEPFFTTKEVGKGTGLGLSLVREIVQKHQGSIVVTSTPGQGTTFSVRLPVNTYPATVESAKLS